MSDLEELERERGNEEYMEVGEVGSLAKDIILDKENDIFYSTASVWEITIKHMLHPKKFCMNGNLLEKGCEENGYLVLPILNKHVSALETLKRLENAPHERNLTGGEKADGMKLSAFLDDLFNEIEITHQSLKAIK